MTEVRRVRWLLVALILFGAVIFFTGIRWGLPARDIDHFLFGVHPIWTGEQILALLPSKDPNRGADVDANPIGNRSTAVVLNETDAQRAEIVRRYRLFTYQPDEMITLMALAEMRPGKLDLDPRLYQYGGLWIYPVGLLLKLGAIVHLVDLRADQAYYLDHPAAFGRFYIVARSYCAIWGIGGIVAIFWIVRRLTNSIYAAAIGCLCYCLLPVVVNMAHEAKPHLPGAVLMLLGIIFATKYVDTGLRRWWIAASIACGCASGIVLSAALIMIILPMMVILRKSSLRQRFLVTLGSIAIAFGTYFIANPYVAINFFIHRERLQSNLSNSAAMYSIHDLGHGTINALRLMFLGTSPVLLAVAMVAGGALILLRRAKGENDRRPLVLLLWVPVVLILLQFAALAAGKPAEYARFALLPDIALMLAAVCGTHNFIDHPHRRAAALLVLPIVTALFGIQYIQGFLRDCSPSTSRMLAAREGQMLLDRGHRTLGMTAEPAPYCCPPLNLFDWKIVLAAPSRQYPKDLAPDAGVLQLSTRDPNPISWANKRFVIASVREPASPYQPFPKTITQSNVTQTVVADSDHPPPIPLPHLQTE